MISPQGYKIGAAPGSENPFWGEGEDSNVNKIFATATVDEGTGVPSVTTTKQISGNDITFGFNFHNLKGERGSQGPAGATGATGPQGPAGADGAQGATGPTGPQGPEGPKGDTGATGPEGPAGPQGEKGADGKDGATGPQGPEGPAGPQGETGAAGAAGKDGVSPTAMVEQTGENQATIYVTDASGTTTAVLTGEAGPAGPAGPQGEKGDTGATGPAGPEGPQGATGPQGPEGPAGPQGEKGDTGATGETGATGPAGPGVAAGGTKGQVLTKKSATDYDTEWQDPSGGSVSVGDSIKGYCEYESFDSFTANQRRIVTLHTGRNYSILTGKKIVHAALSWSYSLGTTQFPIQLNVLDWFEDDNGKLVFTVEAYNTASSNKSMSSNTVRYFIQMIDA